MRLSDIFLGKTPLPAAQVSESQTPANVAAVNKLISSLVPGQTIQGEIVSKNGESVQISVGDQMLLNASIERDMNLEIGSLLTFQVKNNGKALTLNPLFTNTATDPTVFKALDAAGLPVNEKSVNMTKQMMQYGESINRNNLTQMYREINQYKEYAVEDILDLKQMNMPVNEQNLSSLSAYKNLTYQLEAGVETIGNALNDMVDNLVAGGNSQTAAQVVIEGFELLQELGAEDNAVVSQGTATENVNALSTGSEQQAPSQVVSEEVVIEQETAAKAGSEGVYVDAEILQKSENPQLRQLLLQEEPEEAQGTNQNANDSTASGVQKETENQILQQDAVASKDTKVFVPQKELLDLLKEAASKEDTQTLSTLLKDDGLKKLFSEKLSDLTRITPREVADKDKVHSFYEKTLRLMDGLEKILEQNGMKDSGVMNNVKTMNQNIDFLNQINQTMNFVQLPLRLSGSDAHGDLYVYSSKKNLSMEDGKVSAYLHLDMQHLGPVGVYVTMENKNVSTDFTLADEETLLFLEGHMEQLTARLEKRGYSMNYSLKEDSKAASSAGMDPILGQGEAKPVSLQEISFDVRA